MARWAKIASNIHSHPKVVAAGRNGRDVFIWAVCKNAEEALDGEIPAGYFGAKYLARMLDMSEREAEEGLAACEAVELLRVTGCVVEIVGWDPDEWGTANPSDDPDRVRERVRRHRDAKRNDANSVTPPARYIDDVKRMKRGNAVEEIRREEIRKEERENTYVSEVSPPARVSDISESADLDTGSAAQDQARAARDESRAGHDEPQAREAHGLARAPERQARPAKPRPEPHPRAPELADALREQLLTAKPDHVIGLEPKWRKTRPTWIRQFTAILRIDQRDPDKALPLLQWLFGDQGGRDFRFVAESPNALREKWDRIEAAMAMSRQRSQRPQVGHYRHTGDEVYAGGEVKL